jgi:drug/metabolite transporter (DMT)-like permease
MVVLEGGLCIMTIRTAYFLAILGAACWGLIGLFVQHLYAYGFTPWDVVAIRSIFAAFILCLYLSLLNRKMLKIKWKHLTGSVSYRKTINFKIRCKQKCITNCTAFAVLFVLFIKK